MAQTRGSKDLSRAGQGSGQKRPSLLDTVNSGVAQTTPESEAVREYKATASWFNSLSPEEFQATVRRQSRLREARWELYGVGLAFVTGTLSGLLAALTGPVAGIVIAILLAGAALVCCFTVVPSMAAAFRDQAQSLRYANANPFVISVLVGFVSTYSLVAAPVGFFLYLVLR